MKIKRISASFFQGIKFGAYSKSTAMLNENALNLAYKVLFGGQDFYSLTKEEATRINQLLKTCEHLLGRYCAADAPHINNITMFPYLSKAINEFYRECSAGKDFLENQRIKEQKTETQQGRTNHMADASSDWLPKPTKTYLRGAFNKEFGVCPELLYAAFAFYIVKEFYPNLTGSANWQIKQILRLIKHEITTRHAQKDRGAKSHKWDEPDALYRITLKAFDDGDFSHCVGMLELKAEIGRQMHIGKPMATAFIKRLKNDRPESPILQRKKKTKM